MATRLWCGRMRDPCGAVIQTRRPQRSSPRFRQSRAICGAQDRCARARRNLRGSCSNLHGTSDSATAARLRPLLPEHRSANWRADARLLSLRAFGPWRCRPTVPPTPRKIGLATRSNTKDDMPPRNRESNLSAKINLDHRKCEIHSGGHTCRRPDAAILYMDGITFDQHRRTKPLQSVNLTPMGGCPSAIQSSGSGQKERATTHRCDAWHSTDRPGHDVCCGSARKFLSHARLAANRDERIDARQPLICDLRERNISDKSNARRRCEWSSLWRCDLDAIHLARQLIIGSRKHLEGTSDIQQLAIRKREHQNAVRRGHRPSLSAAPHGLKAKDRSIRANGQLAIGFNWLTPKDGAVQHIGWSLAASGQMHALPRRSISVRSTPTSRPDKTG